MTRSEHVQWCKDRALEYCKQGDITSAFSSLCSDLGKHSETRDHVAIQMGMGLLGMGELATVEQMEKFITDCN